MVFPWSAVKKMLRAVLFSKALVFQAARAFAQAVGVNAAV
jgi:hypothetical protein